MNRVANYLSNNGYGKMPVVGIEPSCLLTFNDEFKALKGIENRDKLKNKFYLIEEFILEQIKDGNKVSAHAYNKNVLVFCFQANMYCVFVCKLFGVKVILRSNSSPSGWSKSIIKKKFYRWGFSLANGIIVNSNHFKNQLKKKFGVNATNIYNPLDYKKIIHL